MLSSASSWQEPGLQVYPYWSECFRIRNITLLTQSINAVVKYQNGLAILVGHFCIAISTYKDIMLCLFLLYSSILFLYHPNLLPFFIVFIAFIASPLLRRLVRYLALLRLLLWQLEPVSSLILRFLYFDTTISSIIFSCLRIPHKWTIAFSDSCVFGFKSFIFCEIILYIALNLITVRVFLNYIGGSIMVSVHSSMVTLLVIFCSELVLLLVITYTECVYQCSLLLWERKECTGNNSHSWEKKDIKLWIKNLSVNSIGEDK